MFTQTEFKKNIKENFLQLFSKYKKNKLITAIIYSFNLLDESILTIYYKLYNLLISKYTLNKSLLLDIITYGLNNLICLIINYNLKHMLNKYNYNGIPCLHQIYGENISQLVSFALFIESNRLILRNKIDYEKKQVIFSQFQHSTKNLNLIDALQIISTQNKQILLNNDFLIKQKQIFTNVFKIINLLLFNKNTIKDTQYDNIYEYLFTKKKIK